MALGDRLKEACENVSIALNTGLLYVHVNRRLVAALPTGADARCFFSNKTQDQSHIGSIRDPPILTAGWRILSLDSNVLLLQ